MRLPYSTLCTHRQRAAVGLEHDPAALVRSQDPEAPPGPKGGERVAARMPVVVVGADGDDRDSRPEGPKLVGEPWVGRAVMGDLEHLDRPQRQAPRHLRLRVAREEEVDG